MAEISLSDKIYQDLKWSLIVGEYRPGDVLSIRKLAAKLDVSAMPVREALKRLATERLLVSAANKSYRIADLDAERVSNQFFVRAEMEGIATSLAAQKMTGKQIDQLIDLAEQMDKDVVEGDADNYFSRNYNFHFSIYAASNNEELVWSIERLWALTGPFLAEYVRSVEMSEMEPHWRALHKEIAKAIKSRNSELASKLIEEDISWGTNVFLDMVAKD
ncbi:MAG: GntR family transcriptional regulator [Rhodospirillales bacterium]|jgi:DNA-binding GntR family transcriptional regulator|nr:GntR family transcriptional regulator [Rhodospirillales bacterium]